ncbi:hypothetical protein AN958_11863 [Leucoagaricus sp. SymC.cos]|nr:hypothetical protein AN958_11863 [Leucoagaricus sp. SymC.cos]
MPKNEHYRSTHTFGDVSHTLAIFHFDVTGTLSRPPDPAETVYMHANTKTKVISFIVELPGFNEEDVVLEHYDNILAIRAEPKIFTSYCQIGEFIELCPLGTRSIRVELHASLGANNWRARWQMKDGLLGVEFLKKKPTWEDRDLLNALHALSLRSS